MLLNAGRRWLGDCDNNIDSDPETDSDPDIMSRNPRETAMRRPIRFTSLLGLCLSVALAPAAPADKRAVVFQREPAEGAPAARVLDWPFANYGIRADRFTAGDLDGLAAALPGARLLVLTANSSAVFEHAAAAAAVSNLLADGGTVLFGANGLPSPSRPVAAFFAGLGVDMAMPADLQGGPRYTLAVNPDLDMPLLRTPHNIPKNKPEQRLQGGDRWFKRVPADMRVLMTEQGQPDRPAVLLREGVLGKGRLIVSRDLVLGEMSRCAFRRQVVENLLTACFGPLEQGMAVAAAPATAAGARASAPGGTARAGRRLAFPVDGLNPLYARELTNKPWSHPDWASRLPIVAHNPLARDVQRLPVVVRAAFPAGTAPSSFRVVTPWGEELPSQAAPAEGVAGVYEVSFLARFLELENRPFFIYCDAAPKPAPGYDSELRLIEDERTVTLVNSRLEARLLKAYPDLVHLEPLAGSTGSQFAREHDLAGEALGARLDPPRGSNLAFQAARVIERGPVRIVVEYAGTRNGRPLTARFALYAGQSRLAAQWQAGQDLAWRAGWAPGLGRDLAGAPDRLVYLAPDGLRQLLVAEDVGRLASLDPKTLAEGWYALEDTDTGQWCGECFDLAALRSLNIRVQGYEGLVATRTAAAAAGPVQAAYVALPDRSSLAAFRDQYLEFKQPPAVLLGAVQAREQAPSAWPLPVYGRDLIRAYHQNHSRKGVAEMEYYDPENPKAYIPAWLRQARRAGANAIEFWSRGPVWTSKFGEPLWAGFLEELVRQAHAAGLRVFHGQATDKNKAWYSRNAPPETLGHERDDKQYDLYAIRETLAEIAGEVGRTGVDGFLVQDEEVYAIAHASSRQAFRAKYKMDPAEPVDIAKLADPRHHLTARFQIDTYTEIIRGMAEAFRAQNPRGWVGDQVNVSAMRRVYAGAPHDWETHGEFLTTLSMDLYGKPSSIYKYYIKLMRATFDNAGPIMIIGGGPMPRTHVSANLQYQLMWGIDMIYMFPPRGFSEVEWFREVGLLYHWLDFTGLGDRLAGYLPLPRVALLRDREANLDCLRRGLWSPQGSDHDLRNQALVSVPHLQTDIVMAKFWTPETLRRYPLAVITSDPVLSDALANATRAYVEAGGTAYLEGETIRNPRIADLCGVVPAGAVTNARVECQTPAPIAFVGAVQPVAARGAAVRAAAADGGPVLFERAAGRGKVVYCPLFLSARAGSQEDVAGFVRTVFEALAGPAPLTVEADPAAGLDSNVLTDGQRYLLAVYNDAFKERELRLRWTGQTAKPEAWCAFADGQVLEFTGAAALRLPPFAVRFYYIGDRDGVVPPPLAAAPAAPGIGYGAVPGREITALTLPAASEAAVPGATPAAPAREKQPGLAYVAVLTDQGREGPAAARVTGDQGIFEALRDRKGLAVEYLDRVAPATLAFYDVLIVPNIGVNGRPPVLPDGWETMVRAYVEAGGGLLACHHAVGYRPCAYAYLEEVAAPALDRVVRIRDIRIVADHPVVNARGILARLPEDAANPAFQAQLEASAFRVGDTFQTGFGDYVPLKAGPQGAVLARGVGAGGADGDEPVLVAGTFGQGRVVASGLALGETVRGGRRVEQCAAPDANLLVNAVYWLAGTEGP